MTKPHRDKKPRSKDRPRRKPQVVMKLEIVEIPLEEITADPRNANTHGERNLRQIAASYVSADQQAPLVVRATPPEYVEEYGITTPYITLAGAGRHTALTRLHAGYYDNFKFTQGSPQAGLWPKAACIVSTLEGMRALAYSLNDNATTRSSEWDWEEVAQQIRILKEYEEELLGAFNHDATGFEPFEFEPLMNADWKPPTAEGNNEIADYGAAHEEGADGKKPKPESEGDQVDRARPILVTPNMREVIDAAIRRVREVSDDQTITEGKCIELICADFLAGNGYPKTPPDGGEREGGDE